MRRPCSLGEGKASTSQVVPSCYLLPYTTRSCNVDIYVHLQLHMKKPTLLEDMALKTHF